MITASKTSTGLRELRNASELGLEPEPTEVRQVARYVTSKNGLREAALVLYYNETEQLCLVRINLSQRVYLFV
jgi:hypothetical protein